MFEKFIECHFLTEVDSTNCLGYLAAVKVGSMPFDFKAINVSKLLLVTVFFVELLQKFVSRKWRFFRNRQKALLLFFTIFQ